MADATASYMAWFVRSLSRDTCTASPIAFFKSAMPSRISPIAVPIDSRAEENCPSGEADSGDTVLEGNGDMVLPLPMLLNSGIMPYSL